VRLGVLDLGLTRRPDYGEILVETIEVAEAADRLGYHRYWLGEHHTPAAVWGTSPATMIPMIAGQTQSIRVGVGAILLDYERPLRVANQFRVLGALFDGRIDLGVCRSRADSPGSHAALGGDPAQTGMFDETAHAAKVAELAGFLAARPGRFDEPVVAPTIVSPCELWICGGLSAARVAAARGAGLSLSSFHGGRPASREAARLYRESCRAPRLSVAVCGTIADDVEAARAAWPWDGYVPNLIGPLETWRTFLGDIVREYACDEIMIVDIASGTEARVENLEAWSTIVPSGDQAA
jgi:luciferase family oxidoreductase group 1